MLGAEGGRGWTGVEASVGRVASIAPASIVVLLRVPEAWKTTHVIVKGEVDRKGVSR